jgi:hypothetical protein
LNGQQNIQKKSYSLCVNVKVCVIGLLSEWVSQKVTESIQ